MLLIPLVICSSFYHAFKRHYGITPAEYRKDSPATEPHEEKLCPLGHTSLEALRVPVEGSAQRLDRKGRRAMSQEGSASRSHSDEPSEGAHTKGRGEGVRSL